MLVVLVPILTCIKSTGLQTSMLLELLLKKVLTLINSLFSSGIMTDHLSLFSLLILKIFSEHLKDKFDVRIHLKISVDDILIFSNI